jgi:hypothetical protein
MTPSNARNWKRIGKVAAVIIALVLLGFRYLDVRWTETYSRFYASPSSVEAESLGVLVSRPVLRDSTIHLGSSDARILDLWYEHETRIEYQFLIRRRLVRLGRIRVVAHVQMPQEDAPRGTMFALSGLQESDTLPLDKGSATGQMTEFGYSGIELVADTLRLTWKSDSAR